MNRTGHRTDSFIAGFLRMPTDCTAGGVSRTAEYGNIVQVIDTRDDLRNPPVVWECDDIEKQAANSSYPAMRIVLRRVGRDYWHVEPYAPGPRGSMGMMGGSWIDLGFRWDDLSKKLGIDIGGGPAARLAPVHDRFETAEQMNRYYD